MHSFQEFLSFMGGLFGVICLCTICHTYARRRQLIKKAKFTSENIMPEAPAIKPSAPPESELYLDFSETEINYEEGEEYSERRIPTPSAPPVPIPSAPPASYEPSAPPAPIPSAPPAPAPIPSAPPAPPIIGVIEDTFTC